MALFNEIKESITTLVDWITRLATSREQNRLAKMVECNTAITALETALTTTLRLLTNDNTPVSNVIRGQLNGIWMEADNALRAVDPKLAQRCALKARFWASPETWEDRRRDDSLIELPAMEEAIDEFRAAHAAAKKTANTKKKTPEKKKTPAKKKLSD